MKTFLLTTVILALPAMASGDCPVADLTGDCYVDLQDLAVLASEWLSGSPPPPDMICLPGGTFQMGDPLDDGMYADKDFDKPLHEVMLDAFCIGRTEVTNAHFCTFLNAALQDGRIVVSDGTVYPTDTGTAYPYCDTATVNFHSQIDFAGGLFSVRSKNERDMANDPVVCVTWFGAAAFCNWKSREQGREMCYDPSTWTCDFTKKGYRLPTEAEWEYAARGGLLEQRFPWGESIAHALANYRSSSSFAYDTSLTTGFHPLWSKGSEPFTAPVGQFQPNAYGLYDMIGNVWEWCHDRSGSYSSDPQINPIGPTVGTDRILRGGCWNSLPVHCRTAYRFHLPPDYRSYGGILGFRLCLKRDS